MNEAKALKRLGRVRLIEVGVVKGTRAKDIKVGDKLMWNYGTVTPVKGIRRVSSKYLEFDLLERGKIYKRRMMPDRLVVKA